ncbi:uncharacterized protein LOC126745351 isoform X2 [Anthonomus grandis grandis]|uniref:uncharacterized protein LOC126745351 isoform X2 n=1 Tax=Anthonomus grandis grandis TaxID=2921223 RepID=UPI0021662745|nr:uncharacterized protein LOC126745351 isoform X2 [Anthonomus grandis grandis]
MLALVGFFGDNSTSSYENDQNTHKMPAYLLLPVAGLILIWFRKKLFNFILIHIDELYLPMAFGKGRALLDWSKGRLPPQWSSHSNTLSGGLSDFWTDGSLLCTLINTAIPGACHNPYRHWNKPPNHAQDVTYKYLEISSVFSQSDFELPYSPYIENKLLKYLLLIRKCICKLDQENLINISPEFLARGIGLVTAEQHTETEFFIYSKNENKSLFNIEVYILGPYGTHVRTTVNNEETRGGIRVHMKLDQNKIKVVYTTEYYGIHQICLSCDKESIMGSPYYVNVMPANANIKQNNKLTENFDAENDEVTLKNHDTSSTEPLKISKYLKDISNPHEKQVNPSNETNLENLWPLGPDHFTKENYSYFQKLVDSSFRKSCRITRALPKLSQNVCFQFSSASPVCSDHIVPEGRRKLCVDEKREMFARQKSPPKPVTAGNSSFSNHQENTKETNNVKSNNKSTSKPTHIVQERKTFWETVFKTEEGKATLPKINNYCPLKHTDSLLHKKSLNHLHKKDKKLKKYVSIDENLDVCSQTSLETRTKIYLDKVDPPYTDAVPKNEDHGRFRYRRTNSI